MTEEEFQNYNKWLETPYLENNSLSVIVTSYHIVNYTIELLESLKENILKMPNISVEVLIYEDHRENDLLQKYIENIDLRNWYYFAVPEELSTNSPTYGRTEGIKKATGKYITFIDGDDLLTNNAWKCYIKGIELLEKNKKSIISEFNVSILKENLRKDIHIKPKLNCPIENLAEDFSIGLNTRLNMKTPFWVWNRIYNSNFLKNIKIYDCLSEDRALNIQGYLKYYKTNFINLVGYIHFVNNSSNHLGIRIKQLKINRNEDYLIKLQNTRNFVKDYQFKIMSCKSLYIKNMFRPIIFNSKDIGVMSLGSNCTDVHLIDEFRFRGPLDNLRSIQGFKGISNIFNNQLEKIFFSDSYKRSPWNKLKDNDFSEGTHWVSVRTIFGNSYEMVHNDFEDLKVREELKRRIFVLKDFIKNIQQEPGHYLIYCLGSWDFKNNTFDKGGFDKGLQVLKENKLLDKVIFINTNSPDMNNYNWSAHSYIKSLGLKSIEVNMSKNFIEQSKEYFKRYLINLIK